MTVSVDAVVYYRVSNATISVANVENAHHSTRLLAQTTLRNILGTKHLHEILSERDSISSSMQVQSFLMSNVFSQSKSDNPVFTPKYEQVCKTLNFGHWGSSDFGTIWTRSLKKWFYFFALGPVYFEVLQRPWLGVERR